MIIMIFYSLLTLFIAAVSAAFVLLWSRKLAQNYFSSLYGVRDPHGIEELEAVDIGGLPQWVHIRGRDKNNPILLFIHGGPGWSNIGWHDAFQRPWEDYFTVVQWDQRQTGKSYQSLKKVGHTIHRDQYIADAKELICYLRDRFGHQKIYLMGTSYGTVLGMHLVKQHPEWFYAYIALGQVKTMLEHARDEYKLLLEFAIKTDDKKLKSQLQAMEPYPDPDNLVTSFYTYSHLLMDIESRHGKAYPDSMRALFSMAAIGKWFSPHYTLKDNFNRRFGEVPGSNHAIAKQLLEFDLPQEVGSEFDAPIFFFSGVHDFHISHRTTDAWFAAIKAPYKEQIFFQRSAHVPYQTEPGEFLMALVNKVLPLSSDDRRSIN